MIIRRNLNKLLYDEEELATHSAFAMVFYNFGLLGAMCHVFLMVFLFSHILKNVVRTWRLTITEFIPWQTLLAVWVAILPWWLFTPNAGGMARGSMFFFFIISVILVVDNLSMQQE